MLSLAAVDHVGKSIRHMNFYRTMIYLDKTYELHLYVLAVSEGRELDIASRSIHLLSVPVSRPKLTCVVFTSNRAYTP